MAELDAVSLVRDALKDTGVTLDRLPGRKVASGLHEVKELGPALRASLIALGSPSDSVRLNHTVDIVNWTRDDTQVDLVVLAPGRRAALAAELKVWDIGHQLFDLAKVCCLLATGVTEGFLIAVAKRDGDFVRHPGGELFPEREGVTRDHAFLDLIARHRAEWLRHVGKGRPEPTHVPAHVTTRSVAAGVSIEAYPGHVARAVQISVTDPAPQTLVKGWPQALA
jgi:hypothetical protein